MKKSMESAYTDMMNNLAKSTSAVPLHLQSATGALAWWESPDSLMAKAQIGDDLEKSHVEDKEEAEEEAREEDEEREESEEESEDPEPAPEGMAKSLSALDDLASDMLKAKEPKRVGDSYLPGQMDMFETTREEAEPMEKVPAKAKATPKVVRGSKHEHFEDPYDPKNRPTLSWRGDHPVDHGRGGLDLGKALDTLSEAVAELSSSEAVADGLSKALTELTDLLDV